MGEKAIPNGTGQLIDNGPYAWALVDGVGAAQHKECICVDSPNPAKLRVAVEFGSRLAASKGK